jgi:hypothetical protein
VTEPLVINGAPLTIDEVERVADVVVESISIPTFMTG